MTLQRYEGLGMLDGPVKTPVKRLQKMPTSKIACDGHLVAEHALVNCILPLVAAL
jgi:hypothetical protein